MRDSVSCLQRLIAVWRLVGLALALATIVCWITFHSHGLSNYFEG